MTVKRPQVASENIGNYLLRFEKDTCSRCAGSGSYSRGVGWGCDGKTTTPTRAGENASKRYEEKLDEIMGVPVEDILPGDKVWARFDSTRNLSTFFKPKWRTVTVVSHEIDSNAWINAVPSPRPREQHPEDWVKNPAQVNLYGLPAKEEFDGFNRFTIGEPRGKFAALRGMRFRCLRGQKN